MIFIVTLMESYWGLINPVIMESYYRFDKLTGHGMIFIVILGVELYGYAQTQSIIF